MADARTQVGFWLNLASYPAVARQLVEFPAVIPIRGCLLYQPVALYRLSWFVRSLLNQTRVDLITLHQGSPSLPLRVRYFPVFDDGILMVTENGIALLFLLNVAKCISYRPLGHTPLIYRLFRDGSLYFMMSVTI